MRASVLAALLAIVLPATLASCTSTGTSAPPPPPPEPRLIFEHGPLVVAPAGKVDFEDAYSSPQQRPNVEQDHTMRPADIASQWIDKRLRVNSTLHGAMTITVTDASVVKVPLPMDKSLKARLLSRQAEYKMTGRLAWRVTYQGPLLTAWSSEGSAESSSTILEQSSLNDIDQAYADIIDALGQSFDRRIQEQLAGLREAQSSAVDATGH